MRLWHKSLIPVLPKKWLQAQWRECSAIAGNINLKGTPNHVLVNKVMDYPMNHFISYSYYVRAELTKRDVKTMDSVWNKTISLTDNDYNILPIEEIYPRWHDDTYLTICFYNLYEKWACGAEINDEEMKAIARVCGKEDLIQEWQLY